TFTSKVELKGDQVEIMREIDGGLETISLKAPAILSVDLRLNEPRYASLPNIMKAKKKPMDTMTPEDLGVDATPRITTLKVTEPESRKAGVMVASVDELVEKLKNEAKVI
ncbi:MAG: electron transfer flavoprotein subunit beta/FixA family protein, partial [Alphaproteobacteria bacterium]